MKNIKCIFGSHVIDHSTYESEMKLGHGMFGGPITYVRYTCSRCGKHIFTSYGF